jgi:hypothetical protein
VFHRETVGRPALANQIRYATKRDGESEQAEDHGPDNKWITNGNQCRERNCSLLPQGATDGNEGERELSARVALVHLWMTNGSAAPRRMNKAKEECRSG